MHVVFIEGGYKAKIAQQATENSNVEFLVEKSVKILV